LAARRDAHRTIGDIAEDAGACLHDQLVSDDAALDHTGDTRGVGRHLPLDAAVRALHQRGATNIALDPSVNVQIDRCLDIAADPDIAADQRKGHLPSPGCWRAAVSGRLFAAL